MVAGGVWESKPCTADTAVQTDTAGIVSGKEVVQICQPSMITMAGHTHSKEHNERHGTQLAYKVDHSERSYS